jgi:hypothetical protein
MVTHHPHINITVSVQPATSRLAALVTRLLEMSDGM